MKPIVILLVLLISQIGLAQVQFQKTITGDDVGAYEMTPTADGGYIIAGKIYVNGVTGIDAFLLKLDANGDSVWMKTYGGLGTEAAFRVLQRTDGGYLACGVSYGDFSYWSSLYALRLDVNGDTIWTRYIQGEYEYYLYDAALTQDGGCILSGELDESNTYRFGLVKLDENGIFEWEKKFGALEINLPNSGAPTYDGGFIQAGGTDIFGSFDWFNYVLKTGQSGDLIWAKEFRIDSAFYNAGVTAVDAVQSIDKGFFIAAQGFEGYVSKADSNGNFFWAKKIHSNVGGVKITDLLPEPDGSCIVTGSLTSNIPYIMLIKMNQNGDTIWSRYFGTDMDLLSQSRVHKTNDGGYVIAVTGQESFGDPKAFLIKTDSLGHSGCNEFYNLIQVTSVGVTTYIDSTKQTTISPIIGAPPTFYGTAAGKLTNLCINIGISDIPSENSVVQIFPNPSNFNTVIEINFSLINEPQFSLSDLQGRKLDVADDLSMEASNKYALNTSHLPDGIYVLQVLSGLKRATTKIVVSH